MSEAPKYKDIPVKNDTSVSVMKKEIEFFKIKIEKFLKEKENSKKAALAIAKMIRETQINQK